MLLRVCLPGTRLRLGASNNIVFLDIFDNRHGFLEIPNQLMMD